MNLNPALSRVKSVALTVRDAIAAEMELDTFMSLAEKDRAVFRDLVAACDYLFYLTTKAHATVFDKTESIDEIIVFLERNAQPFDGRIAVVTTELLLQSVDLLIRDCVVPTKKPFWK